MAGYIANTDSAWFKFLKEHRIRNPVFWFKRDTNPNSTAIVVGNHFFLRITGANPPVINALGKIAGTAAMSVQEALDKYGHRPGYESINSMIEHSAAWTSSADLSPPKVEKGKIISELRKHMV